MASRWVYRKADGVFLFGGFYDAQPPDAAYDVVSFPDADPHPDPRLQRYDPATGKRPATAAEIGAYDAERKDATAAWIDDDRLIQAVAQLDFEERQKLQVKAGQTLLTAAQCKARIRAIYRGLL